MEQDSKFQTMAMEGDNKSDEENGSQEVNISKPKSDYFETLCKTLSSGYCILIISIYLVIVVNNFTENKGDHSPHIEPTVLFLYLTAASSGFLIYLLVFLTKPPRSHQNRRSHGSAFLRQGAVIFGLGSVIFFSLDSASHTVNYECVGLLRTLTGFVTILFFALQIFTITFYPRLNLDPGSGEAHFGLLHLVATNVVIWAKTVIKE